MMIIGNVTVTVDLAVVTIVVAVVLQCLVGVVIWETEYEAFICANFVCVVEQSGPSLHVLCCIVMPSYSLLYLQFMCKVAAVHFAVTVSSHVPNLTVTLRRKRDVYDMLLSASRDD
jgi:hypothetical protein